MIEIERKIERVSVVKIETTKMFINKFLFFVEVSKYIYIYVSSNSVNNESIND